MFERNRKAGYSAEALRAIMITVFAVITIPFYSSSMSILTVLSSSFFQWSFLGVLFLVLVYTLYFGPRFFAIKYCGEFNLFSKEQFRKFVRPYWAWVLYPLVIFGGTGLLVFVMIVGGIGVDIERLQAYTAQIYAIPIKEVEDVQLAMIRLNEFGGFISTISQKYVLTSILTFMYVIIEQRSSMKRTILDSSIERLKYVVWSGMIFTLVFSLIVLPYQFQELHSYIRSHVETMPVDAMYAGHLNDILGLQQLLADHDLRWLILQILTGYGNLLTVAIIGFSYFLWRLFFEDVPVKQIVRLIVPKLITDQIDSFAQGFQIDMDFKKDKPQ
jgi:hypothetical protein